MDRISVIGEMERGRGRLWRLRSKVSQVIQLERTQGIFIGFPSAAISREKGKIRS